MTTTDHTKASLIARWLGYLGLIPFVISSMLIWLHPNQQLAFQSLSIYATVILTFIGGVHWGIALQTIQNTGHTPNLSKQFIFSVIPSLFAWIALLLLNEDALIILALGFVLFWWFEKSFYQDTIPSWYARLRTHLTVVASLSIIIGWFGTH